MIFCLMFFSFNRAINLLSLILLRRDKNCNYNLSFIRMVLRIGVSVAESIKWQRLSEHDFYVYYCILSRLHEVLITGRSEVCILGQSVCVFHPKDCILFCRLITTSPFFAYLSLTLKPVSDVYVCFHTFIHFCHQ